MRAFQFTFICVGLVTAASACIFWQLEPDFKVHVAKGEEVEVEMG
jgi:hypothetical protein